MELFPLDPTNDQRQALVDNIIDVYDRATPDQVERGLNWYFVAHDLATMLGGGDSRKGAGILAALSANTGWNQNQAMAANLVTGKTVRGLPLSLARARTIMAGEDPLNVLGNGLKTRNFYLSIRDPHSPFPVTIDRHAHDVAVGERHGTADRGLSVPRRYEVFADAYRAATARLKAHHGAVVTPSQLQAITWVVWTQTEVPERYRRS